MIDVAVAHAHRQVNHRPRRVEQIKDIRYPEADGLFRRRKQPHDG
jgi:hypothetical protein